jgi:hypothetical protein
MTFLEAIMVVTFDVKTLDHIFGLDDDDALCSHPPGGVVVEFRYIFGLGLGVVLTTFFLIAGLSCHRSLSSVFADR